MSQMESIEERKQRFAKIWKISRADAGKTREFMAEGLQVSKKTIQNWENGVTAPDFFEGTEWFRVLGLNPIPYYLAYLFPGMFDDNKKDMNQEEVDHALMLMVSNLTDREKQELLFLMAGDHGSPWYSLLQMFTAHCHTSLKMRTVTAAIILENYTLEKELGELVCPENILPDDQMLKRAIREARKSVSTGSAGYTNAESKSDTDL